MSKNKENRIIHKSRTPGGAELTIEADDEGRTITRLKGEDNEGNGLLSQWYGQGGGNDMDQFYSTYVNKWDVD